MAQELGLTKEQQDKLAKGRQELFAQMRQQQGGGGIAGGGGGFGGPPFGDQQGQAMRARMENLMRSVLNEEQLKKWQAQRSQRGGAGGVRQRPGTLYTLDGKTPKANAVRTGLADDRFTELVGGDLKEGDAVIVKSRTEVKK
jgi:HlyD family secretion protein